MDKYNSILSELQKSIREVYLNAPLAKYTTLGVGGPADLLVIAGTTEAIIKSIELARQTGVHFRILGKGSNLIISDAGFRGMIIVNRSQGWQITEQPSSKAFNHQAEIRYSEAERISSDITSTETEKVFLRIASGNRIPIVIKELFAEGITGLEWFTGIPATIGGAVYMNIHGADTYFGDLVESARLLSGDTVKEVDRSYFQFAYDWCILHKTNEIVLDVVLCLKRGDISKAKEMSRDWARYKAGQPQHSAGCIFQNLTEEEKNRLDIPTHSVGYVIDNLLHLKGMKKGDAIISTKHAAFIENLGRATADDVLYLVNLIKERAQNDLGLELRSEVEII
jgi:UDP-N-acetylenolpyruvoylglucosamine reductase